MSNRNVYRNAIIDGLEVTIHSVNNVFSNPTDLYTCVIPLEFDYEGSVFEHQEETKQITAGASIRTTEVTEGIDRHHLQSRIESPYFRKALLNWFSGPDFERKHATPMVDDVNIAIAQLAYAIRPADEEDLDLGRLYGQKQNMFAKLELNSAWSLVMHNRRSVSSGLDFDFSINKENGLWGTWKIDTGLTSEITDGAFQLVHKNVVAAGVAGRRIPFTHSGKVAYEKQIAINGWFREQFFDRWGHLMSTIAKDTLKFKFDDSCLAEPFKDAAEKGWAGMNQMLVEIGMFPPTVPVAGEPVLQASDLVAGRDLLVDNEWCLIELIDTDGDSEFPWLKKIFIKDNEGHTRPIMVGENARAEYGKAGGYDFSSLKYREKHVREIHLRAIEGASEIVKGRCIWINNVEYDVENIVQARDNAPGFGVAWSVECRAVNSGEELRFVTGAGDLGVYVNCTTYTFGQIGIEYKPKKINQEFGEE